MNNIHPTSIISPEAQISDNVIIGPFCVIGPNVILGSNVQLKSHIVIEGYTQIGANTEIYPFCSLGLKPQDLKYNNESSRLIIGENNVIREYCTFHPGTASDNMETIIGDNGLFMIGTHIAHDCIVGDNVIFANNATLAGHVRVENNVVIGGLAAIHQYVRIGEHAMIGGVTAVVQDVIPYGTVYGARASLEGLNLLGLRRRGYNKDDISLIKNCYEMIFCDTDGKEFKERVRLAEESFGHNENVRVLIEFIKNSSKRGLCQ